MTVPEAAHICGAWRGQGHKPAFEARIVPVSAVVAELGAIEALGRGCEPGGAGEGANSLRVLAICLPASRVTVVAAGPSSLSQRCA